MMNILRLDKTKLTVATVLAAGFFVLFAGMDFFTQQCSVSGTNSISQNLCSDGTVLLARIGQGIAVVLASLCVIFMASKFADAWAEKKSLAPTLFALCISAGIAVLSFSGLIGVLLEAIVLKLI